MNSNTVVNSNPMMNSNNLVNIAAPMTMSSRMNFTQLDIETLDFDKMNFAIKMQKAKFSLHSALAKVSARLVLQNNSLERAAIHLTSHKHNRARVLAK